MLVCYKVITSAWSLLLRSVKIFTPRDYLKVNLSVQCIDLPVHSNVSNINPYRTAFQYGNGMDLHFYQQQESSTTKTVHKVINKGLKAFV